MQRVLRKVSRQRARTVGDDAVKLGRWSVGATQRVVDRKSELAAMDNCGVSLVPRRANVPNEKAGVNRPVVAAPASTATVDSNAAFDSSMDASLCALQSLHGYARRH